MIFFSKFLIFRWYLKLTKFNFHKIFHKILHFKILQILHRNNEIYIKRNRINSKNYVNLLKILTQHILKRLKEISFLFYFLSKDSKKQIAGMSDKKRKDKNDGHDTEKEKNEANTI